MVVGMLIFYLALVLGLEERGYIYSKGMGKYLVYSGIRISVGSDDSDRGLFRIFPADGVNSAEMFLGSVDSINVADLAVNGSRERNIDVGEVYLHPRHGNWNQRILFSMAPDGWVKLFIRDVCVEVKNNKLIGTSCKDAGADDNQLFKWISEKEDKMEEENDPRIYGHGSNPAQVIVLQVPSRHRSHKHRHSEVVNMHM